MSGQETRWKQVTRWQMLWTSKEREERGVRGEGEQTAPFVLLEWKIASITTLLAGATLRSGMLIPEEKRLRDEETQSNSGGEVNFQLCEIKTRKRACVERDVWRV